MTSQPLWIGAVAYDPKVVSIWEGMRRYFVEEAHLPVEVILFQSYEAQNMALLQEGAPRIDIAWHTNLAYVQAMKWSDGACKPIATRDSDIAWKSHIITLAGRGIRGVSDLKGKTIALGSRDSGHAAILPVHFLAQAGLVENVDYRSVRFDTDLGKHGDTGTSEVDVLKAVLEGRVDAGAVGSPFWDGAVAKGLVPKGVEIAWTSPPYNHCMFTTRPGLDPSRAADFVRALHAMSWENPAHRAVLEAEGLKRWLDPARDGYDELVTACDAQGFLRPLQAQ